MTALSFLIPQFSKALANEKYNKLTLPRYNSPSTNLTGLIGHNTIPSARMSEVGTARIGASTSDPYVHYYMGLQLTKPLYINLRQTAEVSSLNASADRLYPGIDFKLRLYEETATRPAIAIGADSAFGHKRMGSEYITLSKRINNFDITGGVAWGRLGSAGHIKNPLRSLSSHFDQKTNYNSEQPRNIDDWFTGEDIGLFGGIEYFTPIKGFSLKADYGANDYIGEQAIDGFDTPDPWSIGLNYKPWKYTDIAAGIIGGKKVMARLTMQGSILDWPEYSYGKNDKFLSNLDNTATSQPNINLSADYPTSLQIGRVARSLTKKTDDTQNHLTIHLQHKGLKGPSVKLIKHDIERALKKSQTSPEEIWHNTTILTEKIINKEKFIFKKLFGLSNKQRSYAYRLILDNKVGLSEEDTGGLYRSSALIEGEKQLLFGLFMGSSIRINLANNLSRLQDYRSINNKVIRSDEDKFASRRVSIDRLYSSFLHSLKSDTHIALSGGYLEEMFAGYGGEILYRPFGKTYAIGAEGWQVYKRDTDTTWNKGLLTEHYNTGHINLYYETPNTNITNYLKIGRYISGDFGATYGIENTFDNKAKLSGFITATNQADTDMFGDTTHLYGGVSFSIPLGSIPFIPSGSEVRVSSVPLARDSGQTLDKPLPLYEVTEPISYRQLHHSWNQILD